MMSKPIRICAAILAAALSFGAVSSALRSYLYSRIYFDHLVPTQVVAAVAERPKTNLVFIGASQTMAGAFPELFDEKIAPLVDGIVSYNIAAPGLSVVEMQPLLEALFKRTCCIRYVVICPAFQITFVDMSPNNTRAIMFFDWRNFVRFVRFFTSYGQRLQPGNDLTFFYAHFKLAIGASLYHYSNFGLVRNLFDPIALTMHVPSPPIWARTERGFSSYGNDPMRADQRELYLSIVQDESRVRQAYLNSDADARRLMPDPLLNQFTDLIDWVEARGVQVIVVLPPTAWQYVYDASLLLRLRDRCGETLAVLDYGDPQKFPDLFIPENHVDPAHLNRSGGILWTEQLAADIGRLIAGGKFSPRADVCRGHST